MVVVFKTNERRDSTISTRCLTINRLGGRQIEGLWFASLSWQDEAGDGMLTFGSKHELACATRSCVMVMPLDHRYHDELESDKMGRLFHVIDVEQPIVSRACRD
jgi:hypothetical protein